jgi:UDP-galactopyranose mutase
MSNTYDYVIVGAGFSGLVLAERLGSKGHRCLVIEKRDHIGGNCHDRTDRNGLLYHVYGPHYFRTNSEQVRTYLSRFTEWREVQYRAQVFTRNRFWSFPVNLATYRQLSDNPQASESDFKRYLAENVVPIASPANSKEAIPRLGRRGALRPVLQGIHLQAMGPSRRGARSFRVPAHSLAKHGRRTLLSRRFQALPKHGYHTLFDRLFDASGADLRLETDYREILPYLRFRHLIYTGPIDEYFGHCYGHLPYRTVRFELEERSVHHTSNGFLQPALQINYPGSEPFNPHR